MKPTKINAQTGSIATLKENFVSNCNQPLFFAVPINCGDVFGNCWVLQSGDQVEILNAPRLYQGINCVKVKKNSSQEEGFIYWMEFVKNFEMVHLVPGNDLPKSKEDKLASKKQKMADPGYYVEYLIDELGQISIPKEGCSVICIGDDATAKYSRYQNDTEWYTLNWNCAPSRKFMNTRQLVPVASKNNMYESRYDYYPSWMDFVNNCNKLVSPLSKRQKAPNDNFSK